MNQLRAFTRLTYLELSADNSLASCSSKLLLNVSFDVGLSDWSRTETVLQLESILDVEHEGLHVPVRNPHQPGRSVRDVRGGGHDDPHRLPGVVHVAGDKQRLGEVLVEGDVVDAGDVLVTDETDHTRHLQGRLWVHQLNVAVGLGGQHEGSVELPGAGGEVVDVLRLSAALDQRLQLGHSLVDGEEAGVLLVFLAPLLEASLKLDIQPTRDLVKPRHNKTDKTTK